MSRAPIQLIQIDKRDAPQTAEDIDATICAKISDKATNPRLLKIVISHMIH